MWWRCARGRANANRPRSACTECRRLVPVHRSKAIFCVTARRSGCIACQLMPRTVVRSPLGDISTTRVGGAALPLPFSLHRGDPCETPSLGKGEDRDGGEKGFTASFRTLPASPGFRLAPERRSYAKVSLRERARACPVLDTIRAHGLHHATQKYPLECVRQVHPFIFHILPNCPDKLLHHATQKHPLETCVRQVCPPILRHAQDERIVPFSTNCTCVRQACPPILRHAQDERIVTFRTNG